MRKLYCILYTLIGPVLFRLAEVVDRYLSEEIWVPLLAAPLFAWAVCLPLIWRPSADRGQPQASLDTSTHTGQATR